MTRAYFELRSNRATPTSQLSADIMRHLHARQHLGKTVIICDDPFVTLRVSRKQWMRLSRYIQRKRAATLNADKILKFTYVIAHMQRMAFSFRPPVDDPDGDVYFIRPDQLGLLPLNCYTVYVASRLMPAQAELLARQLPQAALVVDYLQVAQWEQLGLGARELLEGQLETQWQETQAFFTENGIDVNDLADPDTRNFDHIDDALDALLEVSHEFLQVASDFERALELARPLRVSKVQRLRYDVVALLAHRVQALTPGFLTEQFLKTYAEDDTFYLHDLGRQILFGGLTKVRAIARHQTAGRIRLARALLTAAI